MNIENSIGDEGARMISEELLSNTLLNKLDLTDDYTERDKYNNIKAEMPEEKLNSLGYKFGALIPTFRKFIVTNGMLWFNTFLRTLFPEIDQYNQYSFTTYSLSPLIDTIEYDYCDLTSNCDYLYIFFRYLTMPEDFLKSIFDNVLYIRRYVANPNNNNDHKEFIIINSSAKLTHKLKPSKAKTYDDWVTEMSYYCDIPLGENLYKPFSVGD